MESKDNKYSGRKNFCTTCASMLGEDGPFGPEDIDDIINESYELPPKKPNLY